MHETALHEKISCLDLKKQLQEVKQEIFIAFEKVYDNAAFSGGTFVEEFEKSFAAFCQTEYAIGVNNGTSALHLAMLALGIGEGDEVIVPANTFIATAWAVSYSGATPVFVDCTEDTWQIDVSLVKEKISPKTKAVVGVHLYGQPCDVDSLKTICDHYKIHFVEDAAQAQGALYKGKPVGGFGVMGCFSFYPGKNLGACGEAGGITTNNEGFYRHCNNLRNHGSAVKYYHDELGFNMRMGGLEAASLSVKLNYLSSWNNRRRQIARNYQDRIKNTQIKMQQQPVWANSIYHLFVITTAARDEFVAYLNRRNISPGLHYPVPCHLQKAYSHLHYNEGDCPNAEYLSSHCVSFPMYAELTDEQVDYIIDVINDY